MYIKIKKISKSKAKFGKNNIMITMIGLYDDDDKWIKRIPLSSRAIQILTNAKIYLGDDGLTENKEVKIQKDVPLFSELGEVSLGDKKI